MNMLNLTIDASLHHFLYFTSLHVGAASIADHAVSSSDRTDALGFMARENHRPGLNPWKYRCTSQQLPWATSDALHSQSHLELGFHSLAYRCLGVPS